MEQSDYLKRIQDLANRCERNACLTSTAFLTPAECYELEKRNFSSRDITIVLNGGNPACERKVAFFLPYYMEKKDLDVGETIQAVRVQSYFGSPGHRDYLGAILGLGIERDRIGDILVSGDSAVVFCLASVAPVLLNDFNKVGRYSVKTSSAALSDIVMPERKVKKLSFTVKSMRLDAVTGDMFGVSRTTAAELVRLGAVTLNYSVCEKTDAPIKEGDIISVRGKGKGEITQIGGRSRKDRLFIEAEVYL